MSRDKDHENIIISAKFLILFL